MKFHIVKRDHCPLWKKCCFYLGAVVLAPLAGWATTDDMNESSEDLTTSEWSIDQ